MILTSLTDIRSYLGLHPLLGQAFDFLRNLRGDEPNGRIDLDGDRAFALLQSYTTKPIGQTSVEAHRRYLDVQCVLAGEEHLIWCPLGSLGQPSQVHDDQRDFALWPLPEAYTLCLLKPGLAAILHPDDAHAPGIAAGQPCGVNKVVIKLALEV